MRIFTARYSIILCEAPGRSAVIFFLKDNKPNLPSSPVTGGA